MATLTQQTRVSQIALYPTNSVPELVVERTTDILSDGAVIASTPDRTGYPIDSPEAKAALTQALSDSGITYITVSQ